MTAWQQLRRCWTKPWPNSGARTATRLFCGFENRNLREVGNALGLPDAAQKRVSRAVEKLRAFFARRGIASATAIWQCGFRPLGADRAGWAGQIGHGVAAAKGAAAAVQP